MAILSGRKRNGPSPGHTFDRIKDKNWGSGRGKINRRCDIFTSDYIYVYNDDGDDDSNDDEVGINKDYHRFHDMDWCNGEKNEYHSFDRRIIDMSDNLIEIINPDGSIDITTLEDLLFGED